MLLIKQKCLHFAVRKKEEMGTSGFKLVSNMRPAVLHAGTGRLGTTALLLLNATQVSHV